MKNSTLILGQTFELVSFVIWVYCYFGYLLKERKLFFPKTFLIALKKMYTLSGQMLTLEAF